MCGLNGNETLLGILAGGGFPVAFATGFPAAAPRVPAQYFIVEMDQEVDKAGLDCGSICFKGNEKNLRANGVCSLLILAFGLKLALRSQSDKR